jgi:hypothetical protein
MNIKPGDVKYIYVVLDDGYDQKITKGIYLFKEKDSFNKTWYSFSIHGGEITSTSDTYIFDTEKEIEDYVKAQKEKEAIEREENKKWLESDEYKEIRRQAEEDFGLTFD